MRAVMTAVLGLVLLAPVLVSRMDASSASCDGNYQGVCLPAFSGNDDINCDSPTVSQSSFPSIGTDPYHLDADHNGTACENNGRPGYQAPVLGFHARAVMVARDEPAPPPTSAPTATPGVPSATPTARPTATATPPAPPTPTTRPTVTATPTAPPTPVPTAHTWYTSAASNATYYYCDLDPGWKTLSPANLRSYPSEAALNAAWGASRVKHPASKC